jgi:hypothetical protein
MFFWESFGGAHFFRLVVGQRELCDTLWLLCGDFAGCFVVLCEDFVGDKRER